MICFAFFGGCAFLLFFNLWGRSLENQDYLRYAEVAREMIRSGDWIVPRFNGEVFIHKPPLLFWLIALPSTFYGTVTPFIARLPSAFFAWIGAFVVYLWGRKLWGEDRFGLISSGVLISSYLYFWQGRIARTDMLFSVLILISLYFFYISDREERSYFFASLSFISIGLAGLTKGPVGILFPLLIIFLFLLSQKRLKRFIQAEFILGYLIILFISGAWVLPFLYQVGWDSAYQVWKESKIITRQAPFYLYGLRIWVDFAPWSFFLPFLFYHFWKKEKKTDEVFLWIWFIGLFLLLTLFPAKASKYLLPAFPALALLIGEFWQKRSLLLFGVLFLGSVVAWHGNEFRLIRQNEVRTYGLKLSNELKPYQNKDILGYRIDGDILGKLSFYGDQTIVGVNQLEELKKKIKGRGEITLVTTEMGFQELIHNRIEVALLKKVDYKKGSLILTQIRPF
jgi:4-amino-4-deoxy-L-arabinose transferase-like glycosyltransferase